MLPAHSKHKAIVPPLPTQQHKWHLSAYEYQQVDILLFNKLDH
jgi:hypothetical protein